MPTIDACGNAAREAPIDAAVRAHPLETAGDRQACRSAARRHAGMRAGRL